MTVEIAFGQVLKKYRSEKKLSQESLALKCEFDRTYISLLERGLRNPSLGNVFILVEALDVKIEDFIKDVALVYNTMK